MLLWIKLMARRASFLGCFGALALFSACAGHVDVPSRMQCKDQEPWTTPSYKQRCQYYCPDDRHTLSIEENTITGELTIMCRCKEGVEVFHS